MGLVSQDPSERLFLSVGYKSTKEEEEAEGGGSVNIHCMPGSKLIVVTQT